MPDTLLQDIHGTAHIVLDDGQIDAANFIVLVEARVESGDGVESQVHPAIAVLLFVVFRISLEQGQYPEIAGEEPLVAHGKDVEKILIQSI